MESGGELSIKRRRNVGGEGLLASSVSKHASDVKVLGDEHELKEEHGSHEDELGRSATSLMRVERMDTQ
jgi:hypothetical protein